MKRTAIILRKLKRLTPRETICYVLALICAFLLAKSVATLLYDFLNNEQDYQLLQEYAEESSNNPSMLFESASNITITENAICVTFVKKGSLLLATYDKELNLLSTTKDSISPYFLAALVAIIIFIATFPIFIIIFILLMYLVISGTEPIVCKIKKVFVK